MVTPVIRTYDEPCKLFGRKIHEKDSSSVSPIDSHFSVTMLEKPTKSQVLDEFKDVRICHFVCHGVASAEFPEWGALIVGNSMQEELRIEDLDLVHNDQAQITYLSACSTAEIKQAPLVDENIHLASSFLLSGFPHVVAS
ncbi:hypothetical protein BGZ61DRAFT_373099 [Ilyonectria robusta]|uniref:uncharacterized protein n=1 Tax=Ilyonectria robusta TaxID=1079257 RepID=UPI001E8DD3D8|nr:uncharacterized protein BGZ61DRAFT_373099 [Ilyonectria robusta]KAH8654852.1 hypothetical protein BGZ61DRAFT_373099 [Ilyonectria robusta]